MRSTACASATRPLPEQPEDAERLDVERAARRRRALAGSARSRRGRTARRRSRGRSARPPRRTVASSARVRREPVEPRLAAPPVARVAGRPASVASSPAKNARASRLCSVEAHETSGPPRTSPKPGRPPIGDPVREQPARDAGDQPVVAARAGPRAPLQRGEPDPRLVAGPQRTRAVGARRGRRRPRARRRRAAGPGRASSSAPGAVEVAAQRRARSPSPRSRRSRRARGSDRRAGRRAGGT